ncbi:chemotaxis protein [Bacillus coahuilensis p1.1.43]|uniref:Chemotaxis protein n=2 Tax=Bacillus coahuilensis TaxID=408580 RepID=A0A147K4A4_9BACI|nr:methyl-accepting chemotaxis protein [Bacillus coahuilensis]KUP04168.1 chemotaxis protein [Bacillus coahuilensis p1.1.43]
MNKSLRGKFVGFTTLLAVITYSFTALFLFYVKPTFFSAVSDGAFMLITLVLGIFWSGVLAFFAAQYIISPLKKLEKAANLASEGHIESDVPLPKGKDEIYSLTNSFNKMLENLRLMVGRIEENSSSTASKVEYITQASTGAKESASTVARAMNEISNGAEQSASAVQQTAESVEMVTKIAEQVQEKAKSSQAVSNEMLQSLEETKTIVHSLVKGMENVARDNEDSLQAVKRLEENAKKVEQIIQLVGDISGQTNLLALNASIEAARAGEHGKGFAVVAEEVRKLADESSSAVNGISDLIKTIQQDVYQVVEKISNQVTMVQQEAGKGTKTNDSFAHMTTTITQVVQEVDGISTLIEKQMDAIHHTSHQSQEVAAISEETSAAAAEVAVSTEEQAKAIFEVNELVKELYLESEKMKKTVEKFHL